MNDDKLLLADMLFPHTEVSESGGDTDYYEDRYPPRELPEGAFVTRLGPSPTGFVHLGNLYTALMNSKLAAQTGGVFFLRIEDTDSKREVEGASEALITALSHYGIKADEGACFDLASGALAEVGAYGPYFQSARAEIYRTYARKLVLEGKAYPCFLSENEINDIRQEQEIERKTPGIYGTYAKYRDISPSELSAHLSGGEPYVLRYRADGANPASLPAGASVSNVEVIDGIRGTLTFPENFMDFVILKSDGMPTYHFAHVVDDHLMRTTHVIRGEEWISSLPIHIALHRALGFESPVYCHSTVLMKIDEETGKKRKLSKRKDPELSLEYYREQGYFPLAVKEYLFTVTNSNFEEWRAEHTGEPEDAFEMSLSKMGVSGILFDLFKLADVSKDTLARMPVAEIAEFLLKWAARYDGRLHSLYAKDTAYLEAVLGIGRSGDKPRKDLAFAKQIAEHISYMYDELYDEAMEAGAADSLPDNVSAEDAAHILKAYADGYDENDDRETWFAKIRSLSEELGYAARPKDYKNDPDAYKGHVGDVSTVIRIALTGRASSPDLYEIQEILGGACVRARLSKEH